MLEKKKRDDFSYMSFVKFILEYGPFHICSMFQYLVYFVLVLVMTIY